MCKPVSLSSSFSLGYIAHPRCFFKSAEEKTVGGILLPSTARSKPKGGEVVAVGEGKTLGKNKLEITVKTGGQIVYSKYAGTELKFCGSTHLLLKEDDITPTISSVGAAYNNLQVDSFKLMELLGPEKVDPTDVKLIKDKLFGYSTFWVTNEEPFGDLGEGILFLGNLRGNREDVFSKLQHQLTELTGDKYKLFMVEEPNSEDLDPRGGPRVSFGLLRKEVSEPGPTTLWQYVIALILFLLTIGSSVELGIALTE
ncbi:hypothetical protein IFM89_021804, partial [Coptis chinensis]